MLKVEIQPEDKKDGECQYNENWGYWCDATGHKLNLVIKIHGLNGGIKTKRLRNVEVPPKGEPAKRITYMVSGEGITATRVRIWVVKKQKMPWNLDLSALAARRLEGVVGDDTGSGREVLV